MQFDLLDPEPVYAVPSLPTIPSGLVGFDVETYDPDLERLGPGWFPGGRGHVIGFSLAWRGSDGQDRAGYWPLAHDGGNVEDPEMAVGYLEYLTDREDVTLVAHNAGYELGWLGRWGITPRRPLHDTWLMSATLDDSRRSHSLDSLMRDELGERKQEQLLEAGALRLGVKKKDIKKYLWRLPAPYVARYGEVDALGTLALARLFLPKLAKENLDRAYERERALVPVLTAMRRSGVRVDVARVGQTRDDLLRKEAETADELKRLVGLQVDVWAAESLKKACDELNLPYEKTDKGQPSFTKEWLAAHPHPLCALVLAQRRLHKLRTTFIEGVFMEHLVDGRIYPEVNQVRRDDAGGGTDTGRISYQHPNLQFLPARHGDAARAIRGCVVPDEMDQRWVSADYSQQEPRLTVHFANLARLTGAETAAQAYRTDPTTDFHQLVADMTRLPRKDAKILNLAITYGQGAGTTCAKLGYSTALHEFTGRDGQTRPYLKPGPEGQAIIDQYHAAMPFVSAIDDMAKAAARRRGYVVTLGGRRVRLVGPDGTVWDRKALNWLIQGSAADQTKQAMLDCAAVGLLPKVQVHDELCFSESAVAVPRIKEIMEQALPLCVPSLVDVAVGDTWGDCE